MNSEELLREDKTGKRHYEKPMIRKEKTMNFMFDALKESFEKRGRKYLCRQCSSCHGCR